MAANFTRSFTTLCCLALWGFTCTCDATYIPPPHSTVNPGFPVPMNTNNPGVRKAARFGVYQYNNSSNDLFLFKEWQINKAMVQIVRGLKYMLHVEIGRTVCEKRGHSNLDNCHFQRKKNLQQRIYHPRDFSCLDFGAKTEVGNTCTESPQNLSLKACWFPPTRLRKMLKI